MLGGDAFLTNPYNTAILLAKTASLLRKTYIVSYVPQFSLYGYTGYLMEIPGFLV